jgi:hypothetical protein
MYSMHPRSENTRGREAFPILEGIFKGFFQWMHLLLLELAAYLANGLLGISAKAIRMLGIPLDMSAVFPWLIFVVAIARAVPVLPSGRRIRGRVVRRRRCAGTKRFCPISGLDSLIYFKMQYYGPFFVVNNAHGNSRAKSQFF